ncbi:MAG TPA: SagB family peptide dehydrogenase [Mycobacteriales bacterium]|jgi:SagB-type dehydrogenase family enzyme|nr:SagB family peptide dehydrogenase [Mycobacteriales bacterium]
MSVQTSVLPTPTPAAAPALHRPAAPYHLHTRAGTTLTAAEPGAPPAVVVSTRAGTYRLPVAESAVAELVVSLGATPRPTAELVAELTARPGTALPAVLGLQLALTRLQATGALDSVVLAGAHEVARLTGEGVLPVPPLRRRTPAPGVLSRFTVVTVDGDRLVLQSGLSHLLVRLDPALLPAVVSGALAQSEDWPERGAADLLACAGLLVEPGSEDTREARQWSACDLWFHRRTAESRSVDRYGGTYPLDDVAPLPYGGTDLAVLATVPLPVTDVEHLRRTDPPLAEVMESRRSCRRFDPERPLTLEALAELLSRSCRARRVTVADRGLEVADRPFPSGGSIHELETYLAVTSGQGLAPGLWRYRPDLHALDLVAEPGPAVSRIVTDARSTAQLDADPPVVLLVTARFGRLMWKYETMAYALLLKHTGVLMQTVYLNATAMGLGTCALGGTSTEFFARATGSAPLAEGAVGMMVLGVPAELTAAEADGLWGSR